MKKLLFAAIAFSAVSCSSDNNLEDTFYNVVESSATMVIDSLHHSANKELKRYTGIDSLAHKAGALDTINVEREVEREVKRRIIEQLSR